MRQVETLTLHETSCDMNSTMLQVVTWTLQCYKLWHELYNLEQVVTWTQQFGTSCDINSTIWDKL